MYQREENGVGGGRGGETGQRQGACWDEQGFSVAGAEGAENKGEVSWDKPCGDRTLRLQRDKDFHYTPPTWLAGALLSDFL